VSRDLYRYAGKLTAPCQPPHTYRGDTLSDKPDDSWKSGQNTIGEAIVEDLFRDVPKKGNEHPTNRTPPPGGKRKQDGDGKKPK